MKVAFYLAVGVLFAAYPVLRPYSDETGSAGASAFADALWPLSHTAAILGFIALGLTVLYTGTRSDLAIVTTWVGVGLVLPYYGAEAFALHALGVEAVANGNPALIDLADPIRSSLLQSTMFGLGLILVALGTVAFALRNRYAAGLAAGFVLFLPQFYAPPALRIAHGILILVGSLFAARAVAGTRRSTVLDQPISTTTGA